MTGGQSSPLAGKEVSITGRLASMARDEALRLIEDAGARHVPLPTEKTALVVLGQGGPALGDDGHLTHALARAEYLRDGGAPIEYVDEERFLALLGLEERQENLRRLYTTHQLHRILEVPLRQIRSWVRHELIRPVKVVRRLCFFDFQQVASAKALSHLATAGVKPQTIRRSLEQLGRWLPDAERYLAQLETLEQGRALYVRTEEGRLVEPSGQLRLDFDDARGPAERASLPQLETSQARLFEVGIQAEEEGRLDDAVAIYERALAAGPPQPEIAFNLGNALYSLGRKREAAESFGRATEMETDYVEAWNNLGNALSDLGLPDEAIRVYRYALSIEPDYADAHYNLAETLAGEGETELARRHWKEYLRQDPSSSWAVEVRARLRRTEEGAILPRERPAR